MSSAVLFFCDWITIKYQITSFSPDPMFYSWWIRNFDYWILYYCRKSVYCLWVGVLAMLNSIFLLLCSSVKWVNHLVVATMSAFQHCYRLWFWLQWQAPSILAMLNSTFPLLKHLCILLLSLFLINLISSFIECHLRVNLSVHLTI